MSIRSRRDGFPAAICPFGISLRRSQSTFGGIGCIESKPALRAGFRNAGARSKERRQIRIDEWGVVDPREISRRLKTRKNGVGDLASRNAFFAVAGRNVARPITDILAVRTILHAEEDRRMSVLVSPDLPRPENFHEIARFRLIEVIEVLSKLQLVKQTGCARPICIPAAPDAFAIALISDDQSLQRGIIEAAAGRARAKPRSF